MKTKELIEDVVIDFDGEMFSTESKDSRKSLIEAINSREYHIYWYNWDTIHKMIEKAIKQGAKAKEEEIAKDEISWLENLEKKDLGGEK